MKMFTKQAEEHCTDIKLCYCGCILLFLNCIYLNSLLTNALLYKSLDLLNFASSANKVLILLDILFGRFLIIFGACLKKMLICNGLLFGLLQGWVLLVLRFTVTSKKLTAFKFVSQVTLRSTSSLRIFIKSFSYSVSLRSAGISKTS